MVKAKGKRLRFYCLWRPALEETEHFFLVVALPFFEETGVLDVDDLSFCVEYDEHREAEP